MGLLLVFLFGSMAISFLCSVLESVLMSTPISYITMREEEGYAPASRMKGYKQDTSRPIAAILSLNTIANTFGAAGVGRQATLVFGSEWFGVVSAITTILILVFSEIVPKTLATNNWRSLMGFTTAIIRFLITIMFPIVWCIEKLQRIISPAEKESAVSREEISAMANVAEEGGDLEEDENEMIQNIINMDEVKASDIMTPRVVSAIAPENMTLKTFFRSRKFKHHSRIPLYNESDEYITGYIMRMEALQLAAEDKFDITLGDIKRDIATFNEDTPLDEIWEEMMDKDEQISIVINEYGCFQGILTLEDVIETIVGDEIVDENDTVRDMQQLALEKWSRQRKAKKNNPEKGGETKM